MPTGGSYNATTGAGEIVNLYTKYSGATGGQLEAFRNALSVSLSGYINMGSMNNQGNSGYIWSSTYSNSTNFYRLETNRNAVSTTTSNGRTLGYSVRCILK
jgi:hypothetical protein